MAIHVKSEIGKLKKVMLHRPGQELEHLVPEDLEPASGRKRISHG